MEVGSEGDGDLGEGGEVGAALPVEGDLRVRVRVREE